MEDKDRKRKFRIPKKLIALVLIAVLGFEGFTIYQRKNAEAAKSAGIKTGTVTRQTIVSSLSGSGTISPKDSYNITSLVEGTIISADFEEGDQVTEGQVLYQIDASSEDSKLTSAETSLTQAQKKYSDAASDYSEASTRLSGNTYKSTAEGYIKSLKVKKGDRIGTGTEIAELYNDSVMEIAVPFLSTEAQQITVGSEAVLTISTTLEQITGTVTAVAAMNQTLTGGQVIRNVTIEVTNPGGLTTSMTATAEINGFSSAGDASFTPGQDITITALNLPSQALVTEVLVHEGDYVTSGTALFSLDPEDVSDILSSYQDTVDSAKASVANAEESLSSTQESIGNYTITAPISGTIITKTSKAGDKIQNGSSTTTMAVIYDMSSMQFSMNIDELDISSVSVGQSVTVTADAFSDQTFTGTVTNVSMEGTASNGVTYYPVTVTLDDYGDLRPGMNVEGTITLDEADDVIAIPVDALQRGNVVYVKDSDDTGSKSRETSEDSGNAGSAESAAGSEDASGEAEEDGGSENGARAPETGGSDSGKAEAGENSGAEKSRDGNAAGAESMTDTNCPEGFHAVTVTTGLTSSDYVEITSGNLSEGDVVYISQSTVSSTEDTGMMMGQGGPGGGGPDGNGRPSGGGGAPERKGFS